MNGLELDRRQLLLGSVGAVGVMAQTGLPPTPDTPEGLVYRQWLAWLSREEAAPNIPTYNFETLPEHLSGWYSSLGLPLGSVQISGMNEYSPEQQADFAKLHALSVFRTRDAFEMLQQERPDANPGLLFLPTGILYLEGNSADISPPTGARTRVYDPVDGRYDVEVLYGTDTLHTNFLNEGHHTLNSGGIERGVNRLYSQPAIEALSFLATFDGVRFARGAYPGIDVAIPEAADFRRKLATEYFLPFPHSADYRRLVWAADFLEKNDPDTMVVLFGESVGANIASEVIRNASNFDELNYQILAYQQANLDTLMGVPREDSTIHKTMAGMKGNGLPEDSMSGWDPGVTQIATILHRDKPGETPGPNNAQGFMVPFLTYKVDEQSNVFGIDPGTITQAEYIVGGTTYSINPADIMRAKLEGSDHNGFFIPSNSMHSAGEQFELRLILVVDGVARKHLITYNYEGDPLTDDQKDMIDMTTRSDMPSIVEGKSLQKPKFIGNLVQ